MNRFNMWFANLMRGRYGMDNLNRFLLTISLILIVVDLFLRWRTLNLLIIIILIYVYCRMFSRNINARYRENQKFLQFSSRIRGRTGRSDPEHRIFRCPSCGERLRVPRGAGKIVISCPRCGTKFTKKV